MVITVAKEHVIDCPTQPWKGDDRAEPKLSYQKCLVDEDPMLFGSPIEPRSNQKSNVIHFDKLEIPSLITKVVRPFLNGSNDKGALYGLTPVKTQREMAIEDLKI